MRPINTYFITQILQAFESGANKPILARGIGLAGDQEGMVIKLMASAFSTDNNGELSLDMSNQKSGYFYIIIIIPNVGNFLVFKI